MAIRKFIYEKKNNIAYITFNRPKVLNALNRKTIEELQAILMDARDDLSVRVLIHHRRWRKSICSRRGHQ